MTPSDLVLLLRRGRYRIGTEALLQISIAEHLAAADVAFEREYRLAPAERIDFLVDGGLGVEAKVRCPPRQIYRQLERYARHAEINALVLISGTATGLAPSILGKPVFFVSLGRSAL